METAAVKVVPDLNQLEPTTVQLQPFEVVKGVRHEDIRTPPLRYIQYEYTSRLLGDVFFGKDMDIPGVKITYHIQSAIGGGSQGRDQTYALPALPMRVNSLVPKKAADIRDNTTDTFADIESRAPGSSAELVAVRHRVRLRARAGGTGARARRRPVSRPHAGRRARRCRSARCCAAARRAQPP